MRCLGLIVLAIIGQAYGQDDIDVQAFCEAVCAHEHGGYYAYPGNCCLFIICNKVPPVVRGTLGKVISSVAKCSKPLVWNQGSSSCDFATDALVQGCNASCHDTTPETTLAPTPPVFINKSNECYRDGTYYAKDTDDCFYVNDDASKTVCCDFGQVFNLTDCCCEGNLRVPGCDCVLALGFGAIREPPFIDYEVWDVIQDLYVNYSGISVPSLSEDIQRACFSGDKSYIKIPHLTNFNYGPTFSISVAFEIDQEYTNDAGGVVIDTKMGVLSNGCCDKDGTIEVWLEENRGYITFITEDEELRNYEFTSTTETLVTDPMRLTLTIVYCEPYLTVTYNGIVHDDITLGGAVKSSKCPLTFGNLNDIDESEFKGCMSNILICRDCWSAEQQDRLHSSSVDIRGDLIEC